MDLDNSLGIAGQIIELQEFEQDNSLGFIYDILGEDNFHVIRFFYQPNAVNKWQAAVSFHLTAGEKENVLESINLPENQASLLELVETFK